MKKFEEIVRAMSAKDIIMTMVESLKDPCVNIKMETYGEEINGKCYGCAATNFICRASGIKFTTHDIWSTSLRAVTVNSDYNFMDRFEAAINNLRQGDIVYYNHLAESLSIAKIKYSGYMLPILSNNFTEKELNQYIKLANAQ